MCRDFCKALVGIISFLWYYQNFIFEDPRPTPINPQIPQSKLQFASLLLNDSGIPEEYGYANNPLKVFNEENLFFWQRPRLMKWDSFDVITNRFVLSLSLTDYYLVVGTRLRYYDFITREVKQCSNIFFDYKRPILSQTSYRFNEAENLILEDEEMTLTIKNKPEEDNVYSQSRLILVRCKSIDLELILKMTKPLKQDAMVAVIPLTEEKRHFSYTIKMPNLESEGRIKVGYHENLITKRNSGSSIDWGRGVWPYKKFSTFARGQGFLENGKRISLNFVSGYGDKETNQATEDAFFIDDMMIKLNSVESDVNVNEDRPWKFWTIGTSQKFKECLVTFYPEAVDSLSVNLLFLKGETSMVFGHYTGWVTDGMNKKYHFKSISGFIEIHKGRS